MHSNHTEPSAPILPKRAAYVAAHREYFAYLHLLLDRAALPHCNVHLPNLTTMAAMVNELRELNTTAPWLNSVVLGRVLRRVLPKFLKWHGGKQVLSLPGNSPLMHVETTVYRFPEVKSARFEYDTFSGRLGKWSTNFDQWQIGESRVSCFCDGGSMY